MTMTRLPRLMLALLTVQLCACALVYPPSPNLPNRGDIEAGETVTVKTNENIYTIARAHNVSMRELIVLNDLQPPFAVKPGQSLVLPADTSGGNAMHGYAPPPQPAPMGVIEKQDLAPLPLPASTRGDSHAIAGAGAMGAGTQAVTTTPVGDLNKPSPPPRAVTTTVAPVAQPAPATAKPTELAAATPVPAPSPAVEASAFSASWPVQGPILSNYGPKGQGLNNDGINIGAPKGAPVVAAAGGMVVYAGNEMKGFGNLILIRHQGGWVTAYAHLDRMMVTKDTAVAQGDMIGTVGKTGDVASPQLHFETRLNGKPVDPNTVIKAD